MMAEVGARVHIRRELLEGVPGDAVAFLPGAAPLSARRALSVLGLVWRPGQATRIHDHKLIYSMIRATTSLRVALAGLVAVVAAFRTRRR